MASGFDRIGPSVARIRPQALAVVLSAIRRAKSVGSRSNLSLCRVVGIGCRWSSSPPSHCSWPCGRRLDRGPCQRGNQLELSALPGVVFCWGGGRSPQQKRIDRGTGLQWGRVGPKPDPSQANVDQTRPTLALNRASSGRHRRSRAESGRCRPKGAQHPPGLDRRRPKLRRFRPSANCSALGRIRAILGARPSDSARISWTTGGVGATTTPGC